SGVKKGSGLRPRARFNPSRAISSVKSSSSTLRPALAICAAICAPMVPAPSTATVRIRFGDVISLYLSSPKHQRSRSCLHSLSRWKGLFMAEPAQIARRDDGRICDMELHREPTIEDLYHVEDKAELVNGEIVVMPASG